MNIHRNARTTPYSRAEMVRRAMVLGETQRAVATALDVSERTVAEWLTHYRAEGGADLVGRSSRPQAQPTATPTAIVEPETPQLKRLARTGTVRRAEVLPHSAIFDRFAAKTETGPTRARWRFSTVGSGRNAPFTDRSHDGPRG